MIAHLQTVFAALIPVFALIGLGYALRRVNFPDELFWPRLEQLVYYVLLPALLVGTLATADTRGANLGAVLAAAAMTLGAMALLLAVLRPAFRVDGGGFSSVFQGGIRFNTYLGLAAALAVYGTPGAALAAVTIAFMVPLINVFCVTALTLYAGGSASPAAITRGLVRNPLILACVAGLLLNQSGIGLAGGLDSVFEITGRAALPLGLMTVGAGLRLRTAWGQGGTIAGAAILKLAVMPLLALGAAALTGLDVDETRILVLFAALPTATSAYILARQMGGDATLIATILTVQTILSAVTLPVTLTLMAFMA